MEQKLALALCLWFKKNARILPWRSTPTPYRVWLSEIMLQQTQVTTVLPYFDRFLKKFPTLENLAKADLDEVYQLWAGLGYYSRARNLHKGAKYISELGEFPKNREAWLEVPGVGDYTAGAICSIALKQREPIVDGNVVRVLSRIHAIKKVDAKKTLIWNHARTLVNIKSVKGNKIEPQILNQSLMELGALICKPKNPNCGECPASAFCKGKKTPLLYPAPKLKKVFIHLNESKWIILCNRKVFLIQNEGKAWRHGLWDFPNASQNPSLNHSALKLSTQKPLKWVKNFTVKYVVTNHKVSRDHRVFETKVTREHKNAQSFKNNTHIKGQWFDLNELPGVPAPVKKALLVLSSDLKVNSKRRSV